MTTTVVVEPDRTGVRASGYPQTRLHPQMGPLRHTLSFRGIVCGKRLRMVLAGIQNDPPDRAVEPPTWCVFSMMGEDMPSSLAASGPPSQCPIR